MYKSFASKDDIWNALNAQRMNELIGRVRAAADDLPSPAERILVGLLAQVQFLAQHPNFLRLNIKESLSWATAADIGRGGQRHIWRAGIEMMGHAVEAASVAKELADGLRPATAARLIIAALQIWLTEWIEDGMTRPAGDVADELVEHLMRTLFVDASVVHHE